MKLSSPWMSPSLRSARDPVPALQEDASSALNRAISPSMQRRAPPRKHAADSSAGSPAPNRAISPMMQRSGPPPMNTVEQLLLRAKQQQQSLSGDSFLTNMLARDASPVPQCNDAIPIHSSEQNLNSPHQQHQNQPNSTPPRTEHPKQHEWNAIPPHFALHADLVYTQKKTDQSVINSDWATFVQRQNRSVTEQGVSAVVLASPVHQYSASPYTQSSRQQALPTRNASPMPGRPPSSMNQRTASPMAQRRGSPMTERSPSPSFTPSPFSKRPAAQQSCSSLAVPPPIVQMPSHPLLQQQFAKFVEEQTKTLTAEHYTDVRSAFGGGVGTHEAECRGLVSAALTPESSEVIAREIARLEASRAADAERLQSLMRGRVKVDARTSKRQ